VSAESLFRAGRLDEARAADLEHLPDRPGDARLLKRLGDLALYENRPEDAVRHLGEALRQGPRLHDTGR